MTDEPQATQPDEFVIYNPETGVFIPIRNGSAVPISEFPVDADDYCDVPYEITTDVDRRAKELGVSDTVTGLRGNEDDELTMDSFRRDGPLRFLYERGGRIQTFFRSGESEHGIHFRTTYGHYRIEDRGDGFHLVTLEGAFDHEDLPDRPTDKGIITAVESAPPVEGPWPEQRLRGGPGARIRCLGNDVLVGHGNDESRDLGGSWWDLMTLAMRILSSENTKMVSEAFDRDDLYYPEFEELADEMEDTIGAPYSFTRKSLRDNLYMGDDPDE